jgi:hypothetical protein
VLVVAQRFLDAGYNVAIAEAEPVELLGGTVVEVLGNEDGRPLAAARREYLTIRRQP